MTSPIAPPEPETDPFVLYGGLTEKQLNRARRIQERVATDKTLGQVLLELGEITQEEYDRVLQSHRAELSLVELLVDQGKLTQAGAEQFCADQEANPHATEYARPVRAS